MTDAIHLSEAERQGVSDGTLEANAARRAGDHLTMCESCATDVARLTALMTRSRTAPLPSSGPEIAELWPAIRSRIEQSKVIAMPVSSRSTASHRRTWLMAGGSAVAAGLLILAYIRPLRERDRVPGAPSPAADSSVSVISVADSTQLYEEQARTLLNTLEMQRSMLRPNTAASIDRDLQVIDKSIAELKDALIRDPNNVALRTLLAASYRQKVDLLKRARNAG